MLKRIYSWIYFDLMKWTIEGDFSSKKKYLIVVAPHTSNWDFPIGVFVRRIKGLKSHYVAKKELFVWPLGYFFKALGGFPVERKKKTRFVDSVVELFRQNDHFVLTMTPEGTRSYNPDWKSGYYHVAKNANVPVVYVGMDWGGKQVVIHPEKWMGESWDREQEEAKAVFRQYTGKLPENGVQ
jgi:1-acyl-sn-glycerol-3-phosphate acyltransferase